MAWCCGRKVAPSLAVALLMGVASGTAHAASGTTISPADGATVQVEPLPGFANGDLALQWSVEYAGCPGPDSIHVSYPETRRAGGSEGDWQGQQGGGPFFGPGTFSTTMTLFPGDSPQPYEWRVRVVCGATGGFAGEQVFSAIAGFTLLARSVPLAVESIATAPRTPKAGAPITVRLGVVTEETGAPVTRGTIRCRASVGGAPLVRLARGFVEDAAFCRWKVPKSVGGKELRGTISVVLNGERAGRSFVRRVAA